MNADGFQQLLDSFWDKNKMPRSLIEEDGYCGFLESDDLKVFLRFDQETERFQLYAQIGKLPEQDLGAVAISLAEANCYWRETAGSTLGIAEFSLLVYLQRQIDTDGLDVERLTGVFEGFLGEVEIWDGRLKNLIEGAEAATAGSSKLSDLLPSQAIQV